MTQQETTNTSKKQSNLKKYAVTAVLIVLVTAGVFKLGYVSGQRGYTINKRFQIVRANAAPSNIDYSLLWDALDIVQEKYIDNKNIDQKKVLYGAIKGAVSAAGDEYTEFFDPHDYDDFKTMLGGSFSGIGAEISKKDGAIVIISPIEGTPAANAGLKPKDYIVKINGESTAEMSTDMAVGKIRGKEGTDVTLTIAREGTKEPFDVTITRGKIEIKSVKWDYKDVNGKHIAVITISRFGDDTENLFNAVVAEIYARNNIDGIVIDLRNDPGGYLNTAVALASDWLESGKLIVKEDQTGKEEQLYTSTGVNRLGKYKTAILINGGSASAAEILSGALKDNGKAQLIGEKSFGKGSVQELVPFGGDMAIKVTIAKWITPGGRNLHKDGLDPDIKVSFTPDDYKNGKDPQMDRALQEVSK